MQAKRYTTATEYFPDNLKNMKNTWKDIKQTINTKAKNNYSPCKL